MYILQMLTAVVLDLLLGDPPNSPHPVRLIGRLCTWSEKVTRKWVPNQVIAGLFTVLTVLTVSIGSVSLLLALLTLVAPWLATLAAIGLIYTGIAVRDLLHHSNTVAFLLRGGAPLEECRRAVAAIVGRDTADLDKEGVCRATLESVAENMVDGITAPLFYAILASCAAPLFGLSAIACSAVGITCYKAVNTMDSMIAYKNERYLLFGRIAARLDDLLNFLPARLSGFCLIIAAYILKFEYREAARIFYRDRLQHASPNSGHTEAAAAGALGLRFGGPALYGGVIVAKPFIGEAQRSPDAHDIDRINQLVLLGSAVLVLTLLGLRQALVG